MKLNVIKSLPTNIVFIASDKMYSFIDDPQQKIYTVPRLE